VKVDKVKMEHAKKMMEQVIAGTPSSSFSGAPSCMLPRRRLREIQEPSLEQISSLRKRGRAGLMIGGSDGSKSFNPPRRKGSTSAPQSAAPQSAAPQSKRHKSGEEENGENDAEEQLHHHASVRNIDANLRTKEVRVVHLSELQSRETAAAAAAAAAAASNHSDSDVVPIARTEIWKIDATNAKQHEFPAGRMGGVVSGGSGVVGWRELKKMMVLKMETPPPSHLLTDDWVSNHYKWIVWKAAAMARKFPAQCGDLGRLVSGSDAAVDDGMNWFTPERVLSQLLHRWQVEFGEGKKSCLKRVYENDASSRRFMVLCVARIIRQDKEDGETMWGLELTDGWWV